jgi:DNA-binding response OmpR family regulator
MAYVMIVDDDEDFANAAAIILRSKGHEVRIILDTQSVEKEMKQGHPDIVVLDVMFPDNLSAGFELARRMRHYNRDLKDIPILMLTAVNVKFPLGFGARDIDGHWLPVDDFLEKPVELDALCSKVASMLESVASAGENGGKETE